MEKSLMEPLVESMGPEDGRQEFSEVKVRLANVFKCSVNPGYQNRDFRNRNGTSVIDPGFYRSIQSQVMSASSRSKSNLLMLTLVIFSGWAQKVIGCGWSPHQLVWAYFYGFSVYMYSTLKPDDDEFRRISLPWEQYAPFFTINAWAILSFINSAPGFAVGYVLVAVILFHILSKYVFLKGADAQLRCLSQSYMCMLERSELKMFPNECSHPFREWNDDSGITLRHPRRWSIPVDIEAPDDESGVDGGFPPIYICFDIPGNVHIGETNYDASMKVDACNWALLQSTHKEMIQTPAFFMATCLNWLFLNLVPVAFAYTVLVSSYCLSVGGPNHMSMFVGGLVAFLIFFLVMLFKDNYRHRTMFYQEVTRRVNQVLQKDDTTEDLALEFHDDPPLTGFDPFRTENPFQRYQFVPRVVVDATTKEIDKYNREAWWRDKYR